MKVAKRVQSRQLALGVGGLIVVLMVVVLMAVPDGAAAPQCAVEGADTEALKARIMEEVPREAGVQIEEEWLTPQYAMLLLLPPDHAEFLPLAQEFAAWKAFKGIPAVIEANYTRFTGHDGPERVRNAIKWYYQTYPIEWVLLLGDVELIPIRNIWNNDTSYVTDKEDYRFNQNSKPTDFYYADLTGN